MPKAMTDAEMKSIAEEAFLAAKNAEEEYRRKYGEPMYCGFAWVVIKPATSRFAKFLVREYGDYNKSRRQVHKHHDGGLCVWNPGGSGTQSMDIKEQGAEAFTATLTKYGIDAGWSSRAD